MDSSNLTDLDYVYDVSSKPLGVRRGFGECGRRVVLALASIREGQFSTQRAACSVAVQKALSDSAFYGASLSSELKDALWARFFDCLNGASDRRYTKEGSQDERRAKGDECETVDIEFSSSIDAREVIAHATSEAAEAFIASLHRATRRADRFVAGDVSMSGQLHATRKKFRSRYLCSSIEPEGIADHSSDVALIGDPALK
ncbi:Uncharacterised protein [Afipia felis]|uniref:Uncharacterized protein n=2 Tax=Afipia felis TaxID=1035 RepID=A0A380W2Y1_AFIFE|nr:hypothetical protein AfiDRAFT_1298 [Afipia sp. 1NLS2]EKS30500.1 hypothetical protein HMPREF9697_03028 [Afipia felis ATCC 53690]SUU75245.1 Uncharacterised protein [Afipia felis]SUU83311.1 Uncharacterised protein [Afipia felis]